MAYQHWFISRQKRQLTQILPSLICFYDVCDGQVWSGNSALQLKFEDAIAERGITEHGSLRARRTKQGGGGTRTLFTQMKDLGLVFTEEDNGKVHLTLVGESLIQAEITFVDAMRLQLSRYQYPSATRWTGNGSVDHALKVHPFLFMLRLLRDQKLGGYITMDEMKLIIIHEGVSDSESCFESVVNEILDFRKTGTTRNGVVDTSSGKYGDIANTFFNYLELTQFVDRGYQRILMRHGKESLVDSFLNKPVKFIQHPEIEENYQRAYGIGISTKDLRSFTGEKKSGRKEIEETRIKNEFALLRLQMPITSIDREVVEIISSRTGIDSRTVESFLIKTFPHSNMDDFFLTYKDYAYGGQKYAIDFELATVEIFRKIFGMTAKHTGPIGKTPDVFVESDSEKYCGILDNKAYEKGYNITNDHYNRMVYNYVPGLHTYADAKYPLAFFSYLSADFGKNIDERIKEITDATGINGSAMPVDILIDFAQDYKKCGFTHKDIKNIFSINRKASLEDIPTAGSH